MAWSFTQTENRTWWMGMRAASPSLSTSISSR